MDKLCYRGLEMDRSNDFDWFRMDPQQSKIGPNKMVLFFLDIQSRMVECGTMA